MSLPRFDSWIRSTIGPAAAGAQVFICTQPAVVSTNPTPQAQLYSDSAGLVPITQPLVADGFGHVYCYIASGSYTVVVVYSGSLVLSYPDQAIGVGGLTLPITFTPVTNEYLVGYNGATGTFTAQQPTFANLSGMAVPGQLPVMIGDSGSGGVQGAVPAPPAGSAAAFKYLAADGTFSVPSGTGIGISSVGSSTNATFLTIANSPLTSNGTITANLTTGLTQNYVLATPDGTSGVVGLRALVAADIPNLATTKLTSGVLALARGGNFFNALGDLIYGGVSAAPTVLSGNTQATRQFLGQTGTGSVSAAPAWAAIAVTDLPSIPNTQLTNSSITIDGDGVLLSATAPGSVALGATGTIALIAQAKNTFLSGPTSGSNAAPTFRAIVNADLPVKTFAISYVIDGGGSTPTTSQAYGQINIPINATVTGWVLTADQSGSAVVDIKRSTYSGFPTTSSIAGSDLPTLSSVQKNENLSISSWGSTALTAGDQIQFYLTSATTVTRLNITLICTAAAQ